MDLSEIRENVRYLCEKHDWTHTAETRALYLVAEMGELSRELVALHFASTSERHMDLKYKIGNEMHDVIWNIVALAELLDIDLDEAIVHKMGINTAREWVNNANEGLS